MAIRKQLLVTMENRPGTLAEMCRALGEKKVNILALISSEREGQSLVCMIVDKVPVAKRALQAIGYAYTEDQVLVNEGPKSSGHLRHGGEAARGRGRQHRLRVPWRGSWITAATGCVGGVGFGPREKAGQVATQAFIHARNWLAAMDDGGGCGAGHSHALPCSTA